MKSVTVSRWARPASLATAAVLATGLVPALAGPASANVSDPSFGYLTYAGSGVHSATSDKLWATAPGDPVGAGTLLTPNSYAYAYDTSQDGSTLLVSGQSRALTVPGLNTTYGLLLVKDVAGTVTTRSLATFYDANPVLTTDGSKAFWMDGGTLYAYTVADGATAVASTRFAPVANELVDRIAISPDGTKLAVVYSLYSTSTGALLSSRIKAAALGTGDGYAFQDTVTVASGNPRPVGSALVWDAAGTSVTYARSVGAVQQIASGALVSGSTPVVATALAGTYDIEQNQGTWYLFRDPSATTTEVGTSADLSTAPSGWSPFLTGVRSVRYVPSTVTPPVVSTPSAVLDRATATSYLYFTKKIVPTGTKIMYASLATYLTDRTGTHDPALKVQSRYGVLKASTDAGTTYSNVAITGAPGARLLTWSTGSPFGNGYTSALTRNTWFQWCFAEDVFVKGDCSITTKVTVKPTVSIGVQTAASGWKRVYGAAKRVGGTAVLSKRVSGSWVTVGTATISSTGRFNFGFKKLGKGSYKVVTKADTYWGSGLKLLSI